VKTSAEIRGRIVLTQRLAEHSVNRQLHRANGALTDKVMQRYKTYARLLADLYSDLDKALKREQQEAVALTAPRRVNKKWNGRRRDIA
jgi:hypothetical protein